MFPTIDLIETGSNLRRIMDQRGVTVKEIQQYLGLKSIQSVYHWIKGISLPSLDNLYALSELLQVSMDEIVRGSRNSFDTTRRRRMYEYMKRLHVQDVA